MDAVAVLTSTRLPAGPEKDVQQAIADAFVAASIEFKREVRLTPTDVIDFVVGSTGIEIKIKGARRAIYRQLTRYAAHSDIASLVLVSSVAMGLPAEINGKPVEIVSIGAAWL
jgi:hypothetical protein